MPWQRSRVMSILAFSRSANAIYTFHVKTFLHCPTRSADSLFKLNFITRKLIISQNSTDYSKKVELCNKKEKERENVEAFI